MAEVDENGQCLTNNFMRTFALEIDDKADAAGIVLKLWIIKALLGRQAKPLGLFFGLVDVLNVHLFKRLHLIFPGAVIKLNRSLLLAPPPPVRRD